MIALLLGLCLAATPPPPWVGHVRVQGPEAVGDGPFWDPALTEAPPARDREIAFDATEGLSVRHGAWFQRMPLLHLLRPPTRIHRESLERDRQRVERFFRERGWRAAAVTVEVRPGRSENVRDIVFVVEVGPGAGRYTPTPSPPTTPPPGWTLSPLVSALGRGTPFSVYGGVRATWMGGTPLPPRVDVHAEVGGRAFFDAGEPGAPFGGDVGVWSELGARGLSRHSSGLGLLGAVRFATRPWPAVNDLMSSAEAGIAIGDAPVVVEVVLGGGGWTSWAWPLQAERYAEWIGTDDTSPRFVPSYGSVRADLRVVLDTTDRPLGPRTGARAAISTTPLGFAAGGPFHRGEADLRGFLPVVGHRVVLGLRGRAGALVWRDEAARDLLGERFFLGVDDLRGWGRRRVFPPDFTGDRSDVRPGGNAVLYGNVEVRWHVHRDFSVAAFADAGRVWEEVHQMGFTDLLSDVGASGAAASPLGLLRADIAWRLATQPTDGGIPVQIQLMLSERW